MTCAKDTDIFNLRVLAGSLRYLLDDTCACVRSRALLPRDRNAASNILTSVEVTLAELADETNDT